MTIRVRTNNNTTTVRVGQQNAIKVIASNKVATTAEVISMDSITDVDTGDRAVNTLLMYNGTDYVHVDPARIMDLADNVVDQAVDYGGF